MVDDQGGCGHLLQRVLPGFQILEERDPRKALGVVRSWQPHLLILDISMPEMDGRELAQKVRHADPTRHPPIIFLSALVEGTPEIWPVRVQGHSAFGKPFDVEILQRHIACLVSGREAAEAAVNALLPGLVAGESLLPHSV